MNDRLAARAVPATLAAAARLGWRAAPVVIVAQAVLGLATGLLPVAVAWSTKLVFDGLAAGVGWVALLAPVAGLAGFGVLVGVAPDLDTYLRGRLSRAVERCAVDRLYRAVTGLVGVARLEDPSFRDHLTLAQQAARSGPARLVDDAITAVQATVTLVSLVGVLVTVNPGLAALVVVGAVPALVVTLRLSRERTALMYRLTPQARREHHLSELLTSLAAAREVRLLGLAGLFRGRMLAALTDAHRAQAAQDARQLGRFGGLRLLTAAVAGAGLAWSVWLVAHGRLSIGDVAVLVAATAGTQAALQTLAVRAGTAYQAAMVFHHFRVVTGPQPDLMVPARPREVAPLRTGIELDDVWLRYGEDGPWVLRGVSLVIPYGRSVALVGRNGAGKSTLIKLLCRFYDPTRGVIRWDGVDLRELDVDQLRARVGAVFQDYMSYDLTAAENIGVGDPTGLTDRERVDAAAERAGVAPVLRSLPRGYDTMLSRLFYGQSDVDDPDTGVLLSGGQWQRVALARALMRDRADLMILDEPSSGLDAEAEYEVHTGLRAHRAGRTSLLVSHRLAAVRDADQIVVLDEGRVVERGGHDDLMAAGGVYARLFTLQAAGYAPIGVAS